ncbi:carbamoyltransferase HypF [Streptomyces sp. NPDC006265]|uniref:carbamoyltransferase HypF n=1 Tax=Streptomyces sp. NPDC006265 TaxID=3156740 RepID=UPI0033A08880
MSVRRFRVLGTVQGVGFRPFVYRTAVSLGLDGWVANVDGHVEGEVAGNLRAIDEFATRIRTEAPPLADVRLVGLSTAHAVPRQGFHVRRSAPGPVRAAPRDVPPDAAVCDACLRELYDPTDRRHRYPFINCTDCGPRATIIEGLPYDRVRTTMRRFPLCPACASEYVDPGNRRFHAEPVACPVCGPRLAWADQRGEDALRAAVKAIAGGGIVAVKGLGGYQLVCDADSHDAVSELRRRKRRPAKPFAVMVRDIETAAYLARVGGTERAVLTSPARPVTLLAGRGRHSLAPQVAPGVPRIGLFLPTTGLHHLLLAEVDRPLVVTSGNFSDEPIAIADDRAHRDLASVADGFLTHDRPIRARYDDSVVRIADRTRITVRRARGLAPAPLPLAVTVPLAGLGAQLKHTFTLAGDGRAYLGPHTGDLSDVATYDAFRRSFDDLKRLTGIEPKILAHDLHPGYLSTQWALDRHLRRIPVQHHHAHVAAVAAEHGVRGPFLGIAYDGLGPRGGRHPVGRRDPRRRSERLPPCGQVRDRAPARRRRGGTPPFRTALGHLLDAEALGTPRPSPGLVRRFTDLLDPAEVSAVRAMITRRVNCPRASSAGRLFDTAAALLGLADAVSYEGEAAVCLEAAAGTAHAVPLAHKIVRVGGLWVYDSTPTVADLLERRASGEPVPDLAAAFHLTLAHATSDLVARAVEEGAPRTVCLGGGCFVNGRLLVEVRRRLRAQGLRVLVGGEVPVGDGGISYGQAAVAAAQVAKER